MLVHSNFVLQYRAKNNFYRFYVLALSIGYSVAMYVSKFCPILLKKFLQYDAYIINCYVNNISIIYVYLCISIYIPFMLVEGLFGMIILIIGTSLSEPHINLVFVILICSVCLSVCLFFYLSIHL